MQKLVKRLIDFLGIRWVVVTDSDWTETGEIGLKFGKLPIILAYYKWADPSVLIGSAYREARKREFGEVIKVGECLWM